MDVPYLVAEPVEIVAEEVPVLREALPRSHMSDDVDTHMCVLYTPTRNAFPVID